jgi:N-acyl-D-amino-acid deacylase
MTGWSRRVLLQTMAGGAGALVLPARNRVHARPAAAPAVSGAARAELSFFDDLMSSFVREQRVPGAALAVTRDGRLVYARGFGFADAGRQQPVQPTALFRIASISKPVTAVAVLQLVERSKLSLDAPICDVLQLADPVDGRWKRVTIRHLLQHTGGWDRERSGDPTFRPDQVAAALKVSPPVEAQHVVRYMLRRRLDFEPGTRHAYSNFGYCLLGRAIERASGTAYETYVQREVLAPLGVRHMRLGRTAQPAPNEVAYRSDRARGDAAPDKYARGRGPTPIGTWRIETMDAHGGWIASAVDVVRFAAAFDDPHACPILRRDSITTMFARPPGAAGNATGDRANPVWYGCGWNVRALQRADAINTWHTGSLDGTSTLLVRRFDRTNWAVLFNARTAPDGRRLSDVVDPLIHRAADRVRSWPAADDFARLL